MTTFYLSPMSLNYQTYFSTCKACTDFGWLSPWIWTRDSFRSDCLIYPKTLMKSIRAFSRVDIFIAYLPGNFGTMFEIGFAYTACEELFICANDPVYFKQTNGLGDAHLAALPGIRRAICGSNDIAKALATEYSHLIKTAL